MVLSYFTHPNFREIFYVSDFADTNAWGEKFSTDAYRNVLKEWEFWFINFLPHNLLSMKLSLTILEFTQKKDLRSIHTQTQKHKFML